jgi:hypothetical protein
MESRVPFSGDIDADILPVVSKVAPLWRVPVFLISPLVALLPTDAPAIRFASQFG